MLSPLPCTATACWCRRLLGGFCVPWQGPAAAFVWMPGCSPRNVRKSGRNVYRSVHSSLWAGAICLSNGILKLLETPDITHLCFFTQCLQTETECDGAISACLPSVALAAVVGCRNTFGKDRARCTKGLGCSAVHVPVGQLGFGGGSTSATVSGRER